MNNQLPNRRERRKAAKIAGLFGKKQSTKEKSEKNQRSLAMGNLLRLRNLTEQRNRNKSSE